MAEGRRGEEMATGNNAATTHRRPVIRVNKRFQRTEKKNRELECFGWMFGMEELGSDWVGRREFLRMRMAVKLFDGKS